MRHFRWPSKGSRVPHCGVVFVSLILLVGCGPCFLPHLQRCVSPPVASLLSCLLQRPPVLLLFMGVRQMLPLRKTMQLREASLYVVLMLAVLLFTEEALPGALRVKAEHMRPEEAREEDTDNEDEDDVLAASEIADALHTWVNLPTCESGEIRSLELEAVGDSKEFMCPPHLPVLDPPIHSGEVYTSATAEAPVKLSNYYPEVYLIGTADMGYRITVAALAPATKTLSFRCRSASQRRRYRDRHLHSQRAAVAEPPAPAAANSSPPPPSATDEKTPKSCVILVTVPGASTKPVFKRTIDSFFANAVDESMLIEDTAGEDRPLKVCTGESITLFGEADTNLLFACGSDDQYLSPKRPEFAFGVSNGSCRVGNPKVLEDFIPSAFRLESEGGAHAAFLLLKQHEQQQQQPQQPQETQPSPSPVSSSGNSSEHLPPEGNILQAADAVVRVSTIYKLVITDPPRSPTKFCYQCRANPGGFAGKRAPADCTIFIHINAGEVAAATPQNGTAWWAAAVTLVGLGICLG